MEKVRNRDGTAFVWNGEIRESLFQRGIWIECPLRGNALMDQKALQQAWKNGRFDNGKPVRDEDGNGYGFGWFIDPDKPLVFHSGSWDGTSTNLIMGRNNGLTVAVLSNDENADTEALAEAIYALFNRDEKQDQHGSLFLSAP